MGGSHTRQVHNVSQTSEGSRHEKQSADEENPTYPQDLGVYPDTGFPGKALEGGKTLQPQKPPPGQALPPDQQEHHRHLSRISMVIAHIMAGMKRCRIVKDLFRNTTEKYDHDLEGYPRNLGCPKSIVL